MSASISIAAHRIAKLGINVQNMAFIFCSL